MTNRQKHIFFLMLLICVALIGYFSFRASEFSHECYSDGCLGIFFLYGIAIITFFVQSAILIRHAYLLKKADQPFLAYVICWIVISVFAILVSLYFSELFKHGVIEILMGLGIGVLMVIAFIVQNFANLF
jgi:uncharacterized membrane protein